MNSNSNPEQSTPDSKVAPVYLECDRTSGVKSGHLFEITKEARKLKLTKQVFLARPVWLTLIASGTIPDSEYLARTVLTAFLDEYKQSSFVDGLVMPFRLKEGLQNQVLDFYAVWRIEEEVYFIVIVPQADRQHIVSKLDNFTVELLDSITRML